MRTWVFFFGCFFGCNSDSVGARRPGRGQSHYRWMAISELVMSLFFFYRTVQEAKSIWVLPLLQQTWCLVFTRCRTCCWGAVGWQEHEHTHTHSHTLNHLYHLADKVLPDRPVTHTLMVRVCVCVRDFDVTCACHRQITCFCARLHMHSWPVTSLHTLHHVHAEPVK